MTEENLTGQDAEKIARKLQQLQQQEEEKDQDPQPEPSESSNLLESDDAWLIISIIIAILGYGLIQL